MWESILSWDTLWWILLVIYVPCCIGLIIMVLLQKGKSMGFAGAFGLGGGQDSIFGPRGGATGAARITYGMAAVFMILALIMSLISNKIGKGVAPEQVQEEAQMESGDLGDRGLGSVTGLRVGTTEEGEPGFGYESLPANDGESSPTATEATDAEIEDSAAPEEPRAP